jgi:hypothetical protein
MRVLDACIQQLAGKLDEGDELLTGSEYVQLPGECTRTESLSDQDLVELILSADEPGLVDSAEADEPEPVRPGTTFSEVCCMLEKVEDYMQWCSVVDDSDFDAVKGLREKLQRAHVSGKKQLTLPFFSVARP